MKKMIDGSGCYYCSSHNVQAHGIVGDQGAGQSSPLCDIDMMYKESGRLLV